MTKATSQPASSVDLVFKPLLRRGLDFSALRALFWLTVRQHARARRLVVLGALFLLPAVVAILIRIVSPGRRPEALEFGLVLQLLPHALVPLAALLYASGMIQDEIEDQTLTYLLIRPLPRWSIYLVKLLATVLVTIALTTLAAGAAYAAIYLGAPSAWDALTVRLPRVVALFALALVGYCAILGCLSLFVRRSLVIGVAYIGLFEGVLANWNFAARQLTVMYYFRVLVLRWLGVDWQAVNRVGLNEWSIDLAEAPEALGCVAILLAVSLAVTVLAAYAFGAREFRMKTPEGS